jgi:hypothetical protein
MSNEYTPPPLMSNVTSEFIKDQVGFTDYLIKEENYKRAKERKAPLTKTQEADFGKQVMRAMIRGNAMAAINLRFIEARTTQNLFEDAR